MDYIKSDENRKKTYREKYQNCVRVLGKILKSYYSQKEIRAKFFPNFVKRNYNASSKGQQQRVDNFVEPDGSLFTDYEIIESNIPDRNKRVWSGLECLYLSFLISASENLESKTDFFKVTLARIDQRQDFQGNIFDGSSPALTKNKTIFIDSIKTDILTTISVLDDKDNNFIEEENDFDILISNLETDIGRSEFVRHLGLFYNCCVELMFPRIDEYSEINNLKLLKSLMEETLVNLNNYIGDFDDFKVEVFSKKEELKTQLQGSHDYKKREQRYEHIRKQMIDLENGISNL
ncbi:hypothetical protein P7D85_14330 [Enterococcus hulanensis]|uniref:Uncharacterized protein n=1 Tax=Enterococcus hulanensis TaxID=2559929 RepID=A0ABU3F1H3_9ENTE|nr:hypothetical protein [Enterococcus hulanensis]MDT2600960.1 hypothetical protein [Enterococcus hulanensis]MDT2611549.1 hypothetical protein [Enterococcus hulanensis]MDT2617967.1 hypothetical protein [Enterococcus hulanensis]MDT2628970.1 hypothetical protein [Enterococcus hulanensis]MDT2656532.1 hypothetical protein [Enterococcus hulanensis]